MALSFYFFDVGQGDCTMIIDDEPPYFLAFVDAGSTKNAADTFDKATSESINKIVSMIFIDDSMPPKSKKAEPFIDLIILTHPDRDHVNLIPALLEIEVFQGKSIGRCLVGGRSEFYQKKNIYDPGENKKTKVNIIKYIYEKANVRAVEVPNIALIPDNRKNDYTLVFCDGRISLRILAASLGFKKDRNADSVVTLFEYRLSTTVVGRVIIGGDAEKTTEQIILKYKDKIANFWPVTAIKLGHHGSKKATSKKWLDLIKPSLAFVSSDFRYGHPSKDVIGRLADNFNSLPFTSLPMKYRTIGDNVTIINSDDAGHNIVYTNGQKSPYITHNTTSPIFTNMIFHNYNANDQNAFVSAADNGQAVTSLSSTGTFKSNYLEQKANLYPGVSENMTLGVSWSLTFDNNSAYVQYTPPGPNGDAPDPDCIITSQQFLLSPLGANLSDTSMDIEKNSPTSDQLLGKRNRNLSMVDTNGSMNTSSMKKINSMKGRKNIIINNYKPVDGDDTMQYARKKFKTHDLD